MTQLNRGPIALVGSGEYTSAMRETDLALLQVVGGPAKAQVVVLPTAAGLEHPSSPQRWADMGVRYFSNLGATVKPAMLLTRQDAADPTILALLEQADFYYFSGGNPQHVVESLHDTPAWEIILRRHLAGAALAGCSAGAMAIGGWTPTLGSLRSAGAISFIPALGVEPQLLVFPHFDKMGGFMSSDAFNQRLNEKPQGSLVIGVDEDTALMSVGATNGAREWSVSGRQTVSVFSEKGKRVYKSGEVVNLADALT